MRDAEYVATIGSLSNQELIEALANFNPDGYVEDLWVVTLKEVAKRLPNVDFSKLNLTDVWEKKE